MGNLYQAFVRQLTKNEKNRFNKANRKCIYCGCKISSLPIITKYRMGKCVYYSFWHLSCYLSGGAGGNNEPANAKGLELFIERSGR